MVAEEVAVVGRLPVATPETWYSSEWLQNRNQDWIQQELGSVGTPVSFGQLPMVAHSAVVLFPVRGNGIRIARGKGLRRPWGRVRVPLLGPDPAMPALPLIYPSTDHCTVVLQDKAVVVGYVLVVRRRMSATGG
jgi:hypothetical protein